MLETEPMTQTMKVTDVRERWSASINAVARKQTRIVLEKAGIPVAALVSAEDLERLRRYDAERAARFRVIDDLRQAFKAVPDEELEREIVQAIAEVRAERRVVQTEPAATA
jgi:prevent-host-death family protein